VTQVSIADTEDVQAIRERMVLGSGAMLESSKGWPSIGTEREDLAIEALRCEHVRRGCGRPE
jgi:hypothetical protein